MAAVPARGQPQAARQCEGSGSGVDEKPVVAALVDPAPRGRWRVLGVHRAVVRRRCGVPLVGGRLARLRRSRPDPVAAVLGAGPLLGGPGQTGAPDADARGSGWGGGGRSARVTQTLWNRLGAATFWCVEQLLGLDVRADRVCAVGADTGHVDVSGGDLPRMLRLRRHRPDLPVPEPLYLWLFRRALRFPHALLLLPVGVIAIWLTQRPAHHNPDRHLVPADIAGRRPGWIPFPRPGGSSSSRCRWG